MPSRDAPTSSIRVEVVRARREGAETVTLELPAGARVRDALRAAGFGADAPAVGIFGRRVLPEAALADGDRVELYRSLPLDPMEQRRRRARATGKRAKR